MKTVTTIDTMQVGGAGNYSWVVDQSITNNLAQCQFNVSICTDSFYLSTEVSKETRGTKGEQRGTNGKGQNEERNYLIHEVLDCKNKDLKMARVGSKEPRSFYYRTYYRTYIYTILQESRDSLHLNATWNILEQQQELQQDLACTVRLCMPSSQIVRH